MNNRVRLAILMSFALLLHGCSDIPACEGFYTNKGDSKAIRELVREYQAAIRLAQENQNRILLSEAREITRSRDFRRMEEFSCNVQEAHGQL